MIRETGRSCYGLYSENKISMVPLNSPPTPTPHPLRKNVSVLHGTPICLHRTRCLWVCLQLTEERNNSVKRREDQATANHRIEELKHEQTLLLNNLSAERKNMQKLKVTFAE